MRIHVYFEEDNSNIDVHFIQTECTFNTDFGEVILVKTDDVYTGDYDVTPRVYEQTLETRDKVMVDDVTIRVIPLTKVINLSNGYTVTIG